MTSDIGMLLETSPTIYDNMLRKIFDIYADPESHVAEYFFGKRTDILLALSDRVGPDGLVIGVDELSLRADDDPPNPVFERKNIRLEQKHIPPITDYMSRLDLLVIRGFAWMYKNGLALDRDVSAQRALPRLDLLAGIENAIVPGGYFALFPETKMDMKKFWYHRAIIENFTVNLQPCDVSLKNEYAIYKKLNPERTGIERS